jgi:hypothetical protein
MQMKFEVSRGAVLGFLFGVVVVESAALAATIYLEAKLGEATVAVGTAALAVATFWLGWQTRQLGARTVEVADRAEARRERELLVALSLELAENIEVFQMHLGREMRTSAWDAARGIQLPASIDAAVRAAYAETRLMIGIYRGADKVTGKLSLTLDHLVRAEGLLRSYLGLEGLARIYNPEMKHSDGDKE